MNCFYRISLYFLVTGLAFATQASELSLKNRNRISVTGVQFSGNTLSASYFQGKIKIPWKEVFRVTLQDEHVVYLNDGSRLMGKSAPVDHNSRSFLSLKLADGKVIELKKDQITKIKTRKFFNEEEERKAKAKLVKSRKAWDGNADFGFVLQQGNTEDTQLNMALKTKRTSEFDVFHINLFATQGESNGRENANSAKIQTRFDLKNQDDRYYFLLSSLEYDKIKKIDLRSVLGLGLGWTIHDTKDKKLQFSVGLTTDKESRDDGTKKSLVTALFSTEFRIKAFGSNHIEGVINLYPDIKEWSENLKADSTISYVTPFTEGTDLKLSLTNRYQQTVLPGVEKLDTLLSTSISYKF